MASEPRAPRGVGQGSRAHLPPEYSRYSSYLVLVTPSALFTHRTSLSSRQARERTDRRKEKGKEKGERAGRSNTENSAWEKPGERDRIKPIPTRLDDRSTSKRVGGETGRDSLIQPRQRKGDGPIMPCGYRRISPSSMSSFPPLTITHGPDAARPSPHWIMLLMRPPRSSNLPCSLSAVDSPNQRRNDTFLPLNGDLPKLPHHFPIRAPLAHPNILSCLRPITHQRRHERVYV